LGRQITFHFVNRYFFLRPSLSGGLRILMMGIQS
jgi:hypothetical protein